MGPADIQDSFLTVAEVAELLKLNQQTVRNWIDQGSLPAVRVGRRVRIRQSDLDRVLADGYSAGAGSSTRAAAGPSAEDFWGGEAVGIAEPPAGDPAAPDGEREPTVTERDRPVTERGPFGGGGLRSAVGSDWSDSPGHHDDDRR